MARILLENVTKVFDGKVVAVSDLNLEVADGEFMVIVGPSGCGKTTTLRLIAGLENVTSGRIYIGDSPANDMTPKDRDVAMVFQNYALYPHMTAYQNMAFALRMRKLPKADVHTRVEGAATLLGIENLLHRKPHALSGGQRQRVALGRAIMRNPNAFLFDEPLSNLDAGLRLAMRAELKKLHQRLQTTAVYVTHDQAEAMSLGDRVSVMLDGSIQQTADPVAIYNRPANRFVAGFLGTPPMNFFPGRVEFENDSPRFVIDGEVVVLPGRLGVALRDCCGEQMILGIRPEDISPAEHPGQANSPVAATVEVVEPLGARTDINLATRAGRRFTASVDPNTRFNTGDTVKVYFNAEKIHVFEPQDPGRNVTSGD